MRLSFKTSIQTAPWTDFVDVWRQLDADERFVTGWVNDHLYHPGFSDSGDPRHTYEAFTALAALAALTTRLELGTMVAANLFRHPALVARMATTIDHISNGRFVLGLGAGWHAREHADHGIELLSPGPRLDAFEESCEIISGLLAGRTVDHAGTHYRLTDAGMDPLPVRAKLPLMIGATGERRALRIVARHADRWNMDEQHLDAFEHKAGVLRSFCEEIGRDVADIETSVQVWVREDPAELVSTLDRCRDLAVDEVIVAWMGDHLDRVEGTLDALGAAGY